MAPCEAEVPPRPPALRCRGRALAEAPPLPVEYGGQGWPNVDAALELTARWATPRAAARDAGLAGCVPARFIAAFALGSLSPLPWSRLKPPADPQIPFRSFLPK